MFGTRRRDRPSERPADLAVVPDIGTIALPDVAAIGRQRALDHRLGAGLAGHAGTVIGYDRGDPAHSFERVVDPIRSPTAALARIGTPADATRMAPPPEVTDMASAFELGAYQSTMWTRGSR